MPTISITDVRTDGGTQSPVAMNDAIVSEYAKLLADGVKLPAITVFFDGEHYWAGDGFHRHAAHVRNGAVEIEADVREGTQRDAVMFSLSANEAHGLRRTQADKRNAVLTALADPEWSKLSGREIEKSSLKDVCLPICARFGADLYLPSGEFSLTQAHDLATRKPVVSFTLQAADSASAEMAGDIRPRSDRNRRHD